MIEAFIIAVREGMEIALVVAIMVAVLKERGAMRQFPLVLAGVVIGAALSVGSAWAMVSVLASVLNEELLEGVLFFTTAAFVAAMAWWVARTARTLKSQIADQLEKSYTTGWTLVVMTALLVWREGTEMVLMLNTMGGANVWQSGAGLMAGLGVAVVVGWSLVKGSGGLPVGLIMRSSVWVLWALVAMFVLAGFHEFAEAGLLPFGRREMAIIGPVVSRQAYFFALLFIGWAGFIWHHRSGWPGARWIVIVGLALVGVAGWRKDLPVATSDVHHLGIEGDHITFPPEDSNSSMTFFDFLVPGEAIPVKGLVVRQGDQRVFALDMCQICADPKGYALQGHHVVCRVCSAEFSLAEIGRGAPGCQPAFVAGPFPAHQTSEILVSAFLAARAKAGHANDW